MSLDLSAETHELIRQNRRYNNLTSDLDVARRLLNRAIDHDEHARYGHADIDRIRAGKIIQGIGPDLLIVDPEVT